MRQALFLTVLLLLTPLSGCFGSPENAEESEDESMYPSIWERHTLDWNWTGSYARVLQDGPHAPLPVQEAFIDVDTTGTWEGGPNSAEVHLSYWLPSNTEVGEQVPVIAIVSPYFDYGSPGSQSSPTNVVAGGVVSSSMTISYLMVMLWPRSPSLLRRRAPVVSITAATGKVKESMPPLNGSAHKIGATAM